LSYISLLTPACFWIPFARSIIFHPSIFSLCIPLQVKWISGRQHTVGFIYLFIYWDWVWTQGLQSLVALYHLSHTSSPFCSGYFGRWSLTNSLLVLSFKLNPPHLSVGFIFNPFSQSTSLNWRIKTIYIEGFIER
jgi:hypothetical protein